MKSNALKRVFIVPFVFLLVLIGFDIPVFAASTNQTTTEIVYYDDGSYDIITLTVGLSLNRSTNTKTGSKTVTKYNINNIKQYSFTVIGVFSYDGSAAWATSVSSSYYIYQDGWSCTNRSTSKSGNSVTGSATFKKGIAVNYPSATVYCSSNGVIS